MLSPLSIADAASTLARCIETGSPMAPAMEELSRRFPRGEKQILLSAVERLRDGVPVSRAFEGVLPPEMTTLLEQGGTGLPAVLTHLESQQRSRGRLRRSWRRLWVTFFGQVLAGAIVLTVVLSLLRTTEVIGDLYSQIGIRVPKVTTAVLWLSEHPSLLFLVMLGLPLSMVLAVSIALRSRWGGMLLYMTPLWGRALKTSDLHLMCSLLSLSVRAGGSMAGALRDASRSIRNAHMKRSLLIASVRLEEGVRLSAALSDQTVFPPALVWAVKGAEQSGDLAGVMETFASLYARDHEFLLESAVGVVPLFGAVLFGGLMVVWVTAIILPLITLLRGLSARGFWARGSTADSEWGFVFNNFLWVALLVSIVISIYVLLCRWRFSQHSIVDHLASVVERGLPLSRAVEPVSQDFAGLMPSGLSLVHRSMQEGRPLAEAIRKAPSGLPAVLTNAIGVGEAAGNLVPALAQVRDFMRRKRQAPEGFAVAAFVYMFCLTFLIILGTAFVSAFIVPRFEEVSRSIGLRDASDLEMFSTASTISRFMALGMIVISLFVLAHMVRVAPVGSALGFRGLIVLPLRLFLFLLNTFLLPFRAALDWALEKAPLLNGVFSDQSLWTFCASTALLLRCGASLPHALEVVSTLRLNARTRRRLLALRRHVDEGGSISSFVEKDSFFPPEFRWLVRAGESSGDLGSALTQAADVFEKRAQARHALFGRAVIPSIVLINGLLVFSMAYPTFSYLARVIDGVKLW